MFAASWPPPAFGTHAVRLVLFAHGLARSGLPHRAQQLNSSPECKGISASCWRTTAGSTSCGSIGTGVPPLWDQPRTYPLVRGLQPQIIINDRLGLGRDQPQYDRTIVEQNADYVTPEQQMGGYNDQRPWETCMTLGTQWSWKPEDEIKSFRECMDILLRCVGGDGNLLFDVGPMPSGEIEPRQAERLREMGAWLTRYGQSVYATRGGPFMPWKSGVSTRKDKTVFVHVLRWPGSDVAAAASREDRPKLAPNRRTDHGGSDRCCIRITVPPAGDKEIDTVVALELDSASRRTEPRRHARLGQVACPGQAGAGLQRVCQGPGLGCRQGRGRQRRDSLGHRRRHAPGLLEVELGKPETFDTAYLAEAYPCRVQSFELQYQAGELWKTLPQGHDDW